jgi:hypothetical protein
LKQHTQKGAAYQPLSEHYDDKHTVSPLVLLHPLQHLQPKPVGIIPVELQRSSSSLLLTTTGNTNTSFKRGKTQIPEIETERLRYLWNYEKSQCKFNNS